MTKKTLKFPETIYVRWEEDDEPFLLVNDDLNDCVATGDKIKIGIYNLERVGTVSAEAQLS